MSVFFGFFFGDFSGILRGTGEWRGRKPCFLGFLGEFGFFSQLISEEDGWEEEGEKEGGNGGEDVVE